MSGITIPFAMSKYKKGTAVDAHFYKRILKRFCILFFVGWIVQGNLLGLDPHQFHIFANTLQSIAVGYVVMAILYVNTSLRTQILFGILFFMAYIIVFATAGHMNFAPGTNIAEVIDRAVLGRFRDGIIWNGGTWSFDSDYHYTWILSSCNFIVTVMLGCFAGYILKGQSEAMKKFKRLMLFGIILIIASLAMDPIIPIIKRIWSSSMTLFSGGVCFILMGLFYYFFDIKGWTKGFGWLRFYGMNSLVAYFLGEYMKFDSIADSLFFGLKQWMGIYYPIIDITVQGIIILLVMRWMYKQKIFIKA
jgi:predicted acyltransferase